MLHCWTIKGVLENGSRSNKKILLLIDPPMILDSLNEQIFFVLFDDYDASWVDLFMATNLHWTSNLHWTLNDFSLVPSKPSNSLWSARSRSDWDRMAKFITFIVCFGISDLFFVNRWNYNHQLTIFQHLFRFYDTHRFLPRYRSLPTPRHMYKHCNRRMFAGREFRAC